MVGYQPAPNPKLDRQVHLISLEIHMKKAVPRSNRHHDWFTTFSLAKLCPLEESIVELHILWDPGLKKLIENKIDIYLIAITFRSPQIHGSGPNGSVDFVERFAGEAETCRSDGAAETFEDLEKDFGRDCRKGGFGR